MMTSLPGVWFFHPYIKQVIYRYLDCGILHNGFARVKRKDGGNEYVLAFRANASTSAPPAIRSVWWNLANGSVSQITSALAIP